MVYRFSSRLNMNVISILADTVPLKITHIYKHTYIKQLCTFCCKVSRKNSNLKAPLSGRPQFLSLESLLYLTLRRQKGWRDSRNRASTVLLGWRRASPLCKSSLWQDGEKSTVSFVLAVIISEERPKVTFAGWLAKGQGRFVLRSRAFYF